ncbi:hypothetical protein ACQP1W_23860 [Spirillospora sp. CA-255316]
MNGIILNTAQDNEVSWKLCTCADPPVAALAPLFVAAHLDRAPDEAVRLLELLDERGLAALEELVRPHLAKAIEEMDRDNLDDDRQEYENPSHWYVFDAMTEFSGPSAPEEEVMDRVIAGQPPLVDDPAKCAWVYTGIGRSRRRRSAGSC